MYSIIRSYTSLPMSRIDPVLGGEQILLVHSLAWRV